MRFSCRKCGTVYVVPDARIGQGRRIRCKRCREINVVRPSMLMPAIQSAGNEAKPKPPPVGRDPDAPTTEGPSSSQLFWDEEGEKETRLASLEEIFGQALTESDEEAEAGWGLEHGAQPAPLPVTPPKTPPAAPRPPPPRPTDDVPPPAAPTAVDPQRASDSELYGEETTDAEADPFARPTVAAQLEDLDAPVRAADAGAGGGVEVVLPAAASDRVPPAPEAAAAAEAAASPPDDDSGDEAGFEDETIMADVSEFVGDLMSEPGQARPADPGAPEDRAVPADDDARPPGPSPGAPAEPASASAAAAPIAAPGSEVGDDDRSVDVELEVDDDVAPTVVMDPDAGGAPGTAPDPEPPAAPAPPDGGTEPVDGEPAPDGWEEAALEAAVAAELAREEEARRAREGKLAAASAPPETLLVEGAAGGDSPAMERAATVPEEDKGFPFIRADEVVAVAAPQVHDEPSVQVDLPGGPLAGTAGQSAAGRKLLRLVGYAAVAVLLVAVGVVLGNRGEEWLDLLLRGDEPETAAVADGPEASAGAATAAPAAGETSAGSAPEPAAPPEPEAQPRVRPELAAVYLDRGETAEKAHRLLEARTYAAAAQLKSNYAEAEGLERRLERGLQARLEWYSRPGARCQALARSPEDGLIACAAGDHVLIWDVDTGDEVQRLVGHADQVTDLAFSPDGTQVATGSRDRSVRLWNPSTGGTLARWTEHTRPVRAVAFSPGGSLVASGGDDQTIRLWYTDDTSLAGQLAGHTGAVLALAFSPRGTLLASGGRDRKVRLWTVTTRQRAQTIPVPAPAVTALAFTSEESLLVGNEDGAVRFFRSLSNPDAGREVAAHREAITSLAVSPTEQHVASASRDREVRIVDLAKTGPRRVLEHPHGVDAVVYTADGERLVASTEDGTVSLWHLPTERVRSRITGVGEGLTGIVFDADERFLVAVDSDGFARVWELSTGLGTVFRDEEATQGFRFLLRAPGGESAVTGSKRGVALWDLPAWALQRRLGVRGRAADFSPSGGFLAVTCPDRFIRLFDPESGKAVSKFRGSVADGAAVAFGPRGKLLVAGGNDGRVHLWNVFNRRKSGRPGEDPVTALTFSRDGALVAIGNAVGTIRLWELAQDRERRPLDTGGGAVGVLAFAPDGQYLVSGSADGRVRLWDIELGMPLVVLPPHQGAITGLAFSDDGRKLASASRDGTARLWLLGEGPDFGEQDDAPRRLLAVEEASGLRIEDREALVDPDLYLTRFEPVE